MHKWSFGRIFSSAQSRPPARLLDESVVDRYRVLLDCGDPAPVALVSTGSHSPVSTLPKELVQRIFLTYLDTCNQTSTTQNPIKYSHPRLHAPFLLSSLCRSWRALTLASPLLWTYIVVPALVYTASTPAHLITPHIICDLNRFHERWIGLIQLLLMRSGQSGLDIVIPKLPFKSQGPASANLGPGFHMKAVLRLLPHRARFRTFRMSSDGQPPSIYWKIIGMPRTGVYARLVIHAPVLNTLSLRF